MCARASLSGRSMCEGVEGDSTREGALWSCKYQYQYQGMHHKERTTKSEDALQTDGNRCVKERKGRHNLGRREERKGTSAGSMCARYERRAAEERRDGERTEIEGVCCAGRTDGKQGKKHPSAESGMGDDGDGGLRPAPPNGWIDSDRESAVEEEIRMDEDAPPSLRSHGTWKGGDCAENGTGGMHTGGDGPTGTSAKGAARADPQRPRLLALALSTGLFASRMFPVVRGSTIGD
ncbi:hypothetical protein DFH09DRAFT_1068539 [Mycena vulgaris]|nr:hypothetical protein DFH09DRAFT_1068539 [Mycena vulgaris]